METKVALDSSGLLLADRGLAVLLLLAIWLVGSDFPADESRTLENPDVERFIENNLHREMKPRPPQPWDFNLLTLAAFYYHPDLDVGRARWGMAEAAIITAGARPNPTLGTTPEISANLPSRLSPWILRFTLDFPIESTGKGSIAL